LFYQIFYTVEQTHLRRSSQVSALTTFFEINRVRALLDVFQRMANQREMIS